MTSTSRAASYYLFDAELWQTSPDGSRQLVSSPRLLAKAGQAAELVSSDCIFPDKHGRWPARPWPCGARRSFTVLSKLDAGFLIKFKLTDEWASKMGYSRDRLIAVGSRGAIFEECPESRSPTRSCQIRVSVREISDTSNEVVSSGLNDIKDVATEQQ